MGLSRETWLFFWVQQLPQNNLLWKSGNPKCSTICSGNFGELHTKCIWKLCSGDLLFLFQTDDMVMDWRLNYFHAFMDIGPNCKIRINAVMGLDPKCSMHYSDWDQHFRCTFEGDPKLFDALLGNDQTFQCTIGLGPNCSMHYWFWGQTFRCTIGFGAKLFDALLVLGPNFSMHYWFGAKLFDALLGLGSNFLMHSWVWPQNVRCTQGYCPNIFDALMVMAPTFSMHSWVWPQIFRCTMSRRVHWLWILPFWGFNFQIIPFLTGKQGCVDWYFFKFLKNSRCTTHGRDHWLKLVKSCSWKNK